MPRPDDHKLAAADDSVYTLQLGDEASVWILLSALRTTDLGEEGDSQAPSRAPGSRQSELGDPVFSLMTLWLVAPVATLLL